MTVLTTTGYRLSIADTPDEIAAAARLRYEVFGQELGARLPQAGLEADVDSFDSRCDHLVVVDEASDEVVGTYRLLAPGRGRVRYADTEFDLSTLAPIADHLVEAGRACVHPAHRSGAVINLIWAGIARYLHLHGHRYLGGCVSVGLDDGGVTAATVWRTVAITHQAPPVFRVTPRRPWQLPVTATAAAAVPAGPVPPLLRGYLRLGAWICGDPGYDPDFGSADFYVLLDTDRIDARYWRHFLGSGPAQVGAGAQAVAARGPQ